MPEGDSVWKAARRMAAGLARETWWCPACQPGPFPSLEQRPPRPGLRRGVNEESFGSRGRRLRGEAGYSRGPGR